MLKDHEKFWAFCLLGGGIMALAFVLVFFPLAESSGNQRIIDAIVGGLLLAFGSVANALFRIREESENKVTVDNKPSDPIPTTDSGITGGELPEEQKL